MAKALKVVGIVAGIVAVVASAGAALGLGLAIGATVISAATIATIASVVAMAASFGSQALTKPPPVRGSVTRMIIDPDAPTPYCMGEGFFAGTLRHDTAYGATIKDVPNPYRFMVVTYSVGPVESIEPRVDFETPGSWYNTFLYTDTQTGEAPEASALSPQWGGAPGWDASSKLSGLAAIGWSFKFDKDGKRYASGLPLIGAYGQWAKVYDPRLDDTQPGGSGPHRLGDESTYEYSENPALHAGTYAYGRYQNDIRIIGVGLPADAIDWQTVMAWANVCDDNEWTIFGVLFEPGDRMQNLIDICMAGGAEPAPTGILSFKYDAPVVALDTITIDDLTDDDQEVMTRQSYRDSINTAIPKYRSADHNWEMVDALPVVNSTFLTEDGEEKREVWPFNFVKDAQQAAQLAAYKLFNSREIGPITLVCKPRLRHYRPGECLHISLLDEAGLDLDAIILKRHIDPQTFKVTLTLMGETPAKHAYCLGQVAQAPPTPAIGQTGQDRDELAAASINPAGYITGLISTSYVTDADPLDGLIQATDTSITVETYIRNYDDKQVSVTGDTLTLEDDGTTPIATGTRYHVYYDDETRTGGSVALLATQDSQVAATSNTNPYRHYVGSIVTDTPGGTGTSGGGATPPGWNPGDYNTP